MKEKVVLDCHAMKPFWVSWAGKRLRVGEGLDVGLKELTGVHVPLTFNSLSLATDVDVSGTWQFNFTQHDSGMLNKSNRL